MIDHILNGTHPLAIIISHRYNDPGIHFFTPDDFSQQLAYSQQGDSPARP